MILIEFHGTSSLLIQGESLPFVKVVTISFVTSCEGDPIFDQFPRHCQFKAISRLESTDEYQPFCV
jgi:hypothetical protein